MGNSRKASQAELPPWLVHRLPVYLLVASGDKRKWKSVVSKKCDNVPRREALIGGNPARYALGQFWGG